MATSNRPLSPFLQVYRLHLTMVLSGLHRITGFFLVIGSFLLVYWYLAVAAGGHTYATMAWLYGSVIGQLALFGWTFCLFYHLCNGIRHLFWDAGIGFPHEVARVTGQAVVVASVALTVLTWLTAYMLKGGGA